MKYKETNSISKVGVSKVRLIVEQANCLFHKTENENDLGNDAFIEFVEKEEARCFCIASQIKSGKSYIDSTTNGLVVKTNRDHLQYWNDLNLPVALFVYDPNDDKVYWCDIKKYIYDNKKILNSGPFVIRFSKRYLFSENGFKEFYDHFIKYNPQMSSVESIKHAFSDLMISNRIDTQIVGIKNLFHYHRNETLSWFILINAFRQVQNDELQKYLVSLIQLIPGHGDILWHKGNIFNEETRNESLSILRTNWNEKDIKKAIDLIPEDEGIQRGTIGEGIHAIIDVIDQASSLLKRIAFDRNNNAKTSFFAFEMFFYREQHHLPKDKLLEILYEYEKEFPDSFYTDCYGYMEEIINGNIEFDFYQ